VLTAAVAIGSIWIPPAQVWTVLQAHLTGGAATDVLADQVVWHVRVPRVLLAFLAGAALAVAGAVLQAVVRNPLADPYVLGVSSGAALAAVAVLTLGVASTIGVSGAAFAGAVLTLGLVLLLGRRRGTLEPSRLLLAGVALSYLFQAGTTFLQLRVSSNQLAAVLFWLLGTVSGAEWSDLLLPLGLVVVALGWLFGQARRLNALHLGDDAAVSLGVEVNRLRLWLLIVAAALTATVIAVAGGVGFVGLIAPHAVRLLIGADHRRLLPVAALTGGLFLVLADLAGRVAVAPLELPLGVVTAVAGVPFFLLLLRRSGRAA
jgi:iron complex transport system permease protein